MSKAASDTPSECYVCTQPTNTKLGAIPYCPRCLPRDPRVKTVREGSVRVRVEPRPTPPLHSRPVECAVEPGGFCNGWCMKHLCTSDFCAC